jgi:hypothetical protein
VNIKRYAVTDADRRPIRSTMIGRQVSDYTGAAATLGSLQKVTCLLADLDNDANWFREALKKG